MFAQSVRSVLYRLNLIKIAGLEPWPGYRFPSITDDQLFENMKKVSDQEYEKTGNIPTSSRKFDEKSEHTRNTYKSHWGDENKSWENVLKRVLELLNVKREKPLYYNLLISRITGVKKVISKTRERIFLKVNQLMVSLYALEDLSTAQKMNRA